MGNSSDSESHNLALFSNECSNTVTSFTSFKLISTSFPFILIFSTEPIISYMLSPTITLVSERHLSVFGGVGFTEPVGHFILSHMPSDSTVVHVPMGHLTHVLAVDTTYPKLHKILVQ